MRGAPFETHTATRDEMPQAVASIVAAFITDPLARFLWPSTRDYLNAMPSLVREYATGSFESRTAFVCAELCGAALWLPPHMSPSFDALDQLFQWAVKSERLDDVRMAFEKMEEWRPNEPHWYLTFVGVAPRAQSKGIGHALMSYSAARCDQEGVLAYLESTNPRNVSLYERHGFESIGEIQVGKAPVITPMLRRPR